MSGDVLTTFSGLFHILGALQDALHHPWPSKSLVWTSSGQKVAKKPDEMKKKTLAFGSLERKFDWLSVAFFTSLVPYKMPYIILDLLAALSVVQEVQKYKKSSQNEENTCH